MADSFANPGVSRSLIVDTTVNDTSSRVAVNQIRGTDPKNATGSGIPRQVTNVSASIANGATGSTSTVRVTFHRDPSDKNYSEVVVWAKGYKGNDNPVRVGGSYESPATFILDNTGEPVSLIVQASGNGGSAPLSSSPTTGITLPKSVSGGYGSNSIVYVNNDNVTAGLTLETAGQGYFIAAGCKDMSPQINSFMAQITNRAANVVVVQQFILDETWTLSKVSYALSTGAALSHFNFGIYDAAGNKLIDSGAFDGSITTAQTKSFTPVTLSPGVYYFAVSETTAGTLQGPVAQQGAATLNKFLGYFTSTTPFAGTATGTTSSNVMPSTLGTITAATATWFQGLPLCVWQV